MNLRGLRARRLSEARAQLRLIAGQEKRLERALAQEISRTVETAAGSYPDWSAAIRPHQERLTRLLNRSAAETASLAAKRGRLAFKSGHLLPGVEIKLDTGDELNARIVKWARKRAAGRVADISKTTERRIRNAVARGLDANDSPAEIARAIIDEVDDMTLARARTIARTETHTAANSGQHMAMEETADELGMKMNKVWVATEDQRTRESHTAADGQVVAMDEWFKVGEAELYFPGDPDGPPEEIINCRCAVVYEPA